MKKRMLITTESLTIGGVETSLLSFIKALKEYYEIDLYVLKSGELKNEFEKEVKVNFIKMPKIKSKLIYRIYKNLFFNSLKNKYKLLSTQYDVAIAYYGINNFCDAFALAANAKKHFIWVHNNFETSYKLSPLKLLLKIRNLIIKNKFLSFDKIISVSESAKKGFRNIMRIEEDKIAVINNLIDLQQFSKKDEKLEIEMKGKHKLVYVGRLSKGKRVDKLLYEFKKIKRELADAELFIIGDGPELQYLKKIVHDNKIQNVYFLGFQKNPFKYINKCEIVVSASESEAYGMNLVEALVLKKYFVSADNDGAKEIFSNLNKENKENGIVCEVNLIHKYCLDYLKNKEKKEPNFDIKNANKKILSQLLNEFNI